LGRWAVWTLAAVIVSVLFSRAPAGGQHGMKFGGEGMTGAGDHQRGREE
jgi:hypothetical protein